MKKFVATVVLLFPATLFAQMPFTGTWKMNPDKSRFSTGLVVFSLRDGIYECTFCVPKIHVKADGNDQLIAGLPHDTLAVKEIDSHTVRFVFKQDGRIASEELRTAAGNGRVLHDEGTHYPAGPGKPMVSEDTLQRVGDPIPGANATSGSWKTEKTDSSRPLLAIFKETDTDLSTSAPGSTWTASFDGKDYPVRGTYGVNSVALRKIDSHTIELTFKVDDATVVRVDTLTISADGKTMTTVSQSKPSGRTSIWVFTKQEQ